MLRLLFCRLFLLCPPLAWAAAPEAPTALVPPVAPADPAAPSPKAEGDTIHAPPRIEWEKIAELPPRHGEPKNPGLGGAFAGAQEDVFIVAGGTNYPQGHPWTGAKRSVYKDIYVLERTAEPGGAPTYKWIDPQAELPGSLSYGASVSLPDGVLCTGGAALDAVRDECFLLSWNKAARKVEITPFPKLPKPLFCHTAVLLKNVVYVLGGTQEINGRATNSFYALDLAKRKSPTGFEWKALPAWDGPARIFPVAAASLEGETESLILCGGRDPGNEPDFLIDLHRFNPAKRDWSLLGDVVDRQGHPGYVMGTPAFHVPPHHFVVVGGMDEDITKLLERNARDLKDIDEAERERRKKYEAQILENFPGYPRTVLGYDSVIGEWNHLGSFPAEVPLTNPAVAWESLIVIPGGETGPGKRTPEIWAATVRKKPLIVQQDPPAPDTASDVPAPAQPPPSALPGEKPLSGGKVSAPKPGSKSSAKPRRKQPARPAPAAPETVRPGPPRPDTLPPP
jgi:N-acetylneuraminic acid mutarotase